MLEILQFIFSSFWVWLGTFFLLGVITTGIRGNFCLISFGGRKEK